MAARSDHSQTTGWTTVSDVTPTRIVFDSPGEDVFEGVFLGHELAEPENDEPFDTLVFRGDDNELYSTAPGYKLTKAFEKIPEGTMCRIEYIKDVPITGQQSPMKDFRVLTK